MEAADRVARTPTAFCRTLPVQSPFFSRYQNARRVVELQPKPVALGSKAVDQLSWRQYQSYLARVRPVARADFYKRLRERQGCQSIRALARTTGEDWSRVAKVLKLLELPAPVLEYLRTHDDPHVVRFFSERRLRDLLRHRDARRIWQEFQVLLEEARRGAIAPSRSEA